MSIASYALGEAGLGEGQLERIRGLEARGEDRVRTPRSLTPLERLDREGGVQDWLDTHDLDDIDLDAAALAEIGIDAEELDELLSLLGRSALPAVLERAVGWYTILSLIAEIGHGSGRIAEIVRALKSYIHLGESPVQSVDLNEGLNDTLVMLNGILREGVRVTRDLDAALPSSTCAAPSSIRCGPI